MFDQLVHSDLNRTNEVACVKGLERKEQCIDLFVWEHMVLFEYEVCRIRFHLKLPVWLRLRVRTSLFDVALLVD